VGNKAPDWVHRGFSEYAKRMPRDMPLTLVEFPAPKHRGDAARFVQAEGAKMVAQLAANEWVVALQESGRSLSSAGLARRLDHWRLQGQNIAFVIGGSDGLADAVLARADEQVSLSALTFPHYMVRVILAEALYRAWSICSGHPYHRA